MSAELQQLTTDVAVLEERMETRQAECKIDIGRLAEDAAKRETRLVITAAGMLALSAAIPGTLISFQN